MRKNDIPLKVRLQLQRIAKKSVPYEMCGVLVWDELDDMQFIEVPNVHADPKTGFALHPARLAMIDAKANILAYVHSHPYGTSEPSALDMQQVNQHGKPFVIVGMSDDDISVTMPKELPLIGRDYVYGAYDCFTIVRDYYKRELAIEIKEYNYDELWWEDPNAESLYINHYAENGFIEVPLSELQKHDVLICYWGDTVHPNHAIIFLGQDPVFKSEPLIDLIGDRLFLHHLYGTKSRVEVLGEQRLHTVAKVLRHENLHR